jgi:hypothetical protein
MLGLSCRTPLGAPRTTKHWDPARRDIMRRLRLLELSRRLAKLLGLMVSNCRQPGWDAKLPLALVKASPFGIACVGSNTMYRRGNRQEFR